MYRLSIFILFVYIIFCGIPNVLGKDIVKKNIKETTELAEIKNVEQIKPYLKNSDKDVRMAGIERISEIGGKEAKEILFKMLGDALEENIERSVDENYFYLRELEVISESLYNLYEAEEDTEIYNFFSNIALNKIEDKNILTNDRLRVISYKIYLKKAISDKLKEGLRKKDILQEIDNSIKPYKKYYDGSGILSQEAVEFNAKKELLKEER